MSVPFKGDGGCRRTTIGISLSKIFDRSGVFRTVLKTLRDQISALEVGMAKSGNVESF